MKEGKKITCKQDDLGQHICAVNSCEGSTYKPYVIRYLVSFCLLSTTVIPNKLRQPHYYCSVSKYALSSAGSLGSSLFMVSLSPWH